MITIYLHGFSGDDKGLKEFAEAMHAYPYHLWLLPGFGGSAVSKEAQKDLKVYCEDVMRSLQETYPSGIFHIVGHSHGAIIAYSLAALYPATVVKLTLINPVARPRFISRLVSGAVNAATYVLPSWMLLKTMSSKVIVDTMSRYMASDHKGEAKDRIYSTRRRETKYYTKDMFRLSQHATAFQTFMDESHVVAPTLIVYDTDDPIAGSEDVRWFAERCPDNEQLVVTGGHLGVVAIPDDIATKVRER